MKCVVKESVFETSKITLMKKKTDGRCPEILIEFDNGLVHCCFFDTVEELESEWLRIMKCWRSDEEQNDIDIPHTC